MAVPANHHAYLDKGDTGRLLEVEFGWDDLVTRARLKAPPTVESKPIGERDDDVGARVLRGVGVWTFRVDPSDAALAGASVSVRTQICDEKIGLCYPPERRTVSL